MFPQLQLMAFDSLTLVLVERVWISWLALVIASKRLFELIRKALIDEGFFLGFLIIQYGIVIRMFR